MVWVWLHLGKNIFRRIRLLNLMAISNVVIGLEWAGMYLEIQYWVVF